MYFSCFRHALSITHVKHGLSTSPMSDMPYLLPLHVSKTCLIYKYFPCGQTWLTYFSCFRHPYQLLMSIPTSPVSNMSQTCLIYFLRAKCALPPNPPTHPPTHTHIHTHHFLLISTTPQPTFLPLNLVELHGLAGWQLESHPELNTTHTGVRAGTSVHTWNKERKGRREEGGREG